MWDKRAASSECGTADRLSLTEHHENFFLMKEVSMIRLICGLAAMS
jgi:hypothetical protein